MIMDEWLDHMLNTPMSDLEWWELGIVLAALLGTLAALFALNSFRGWRRHG